MLAQYAEAIHREIHKNAGILNYALGRALLCYSDSTDAFATPSISTRDINKLIIGHVSCDGFDYQFRVRSPYSHTPPQA